ncbi:uncharacterized protein LOC133440964 isoform X1 [Cololabis saira]|uniref:uncharacterized protein LOC133440964 isoform X1 n=1 Tax=Cololabis saira TaxID=129043 RepID=UPI002AD59C18|nr:uncharacterized protein LOC133440964 isoform X1 [Cololabis saira]
MSHFYFTFLLFILLKIIPDCRGDETVSASKHEDVSLSCLESDITDPESSYRVRWTKKTTETDEVVIFEWPGKSKDEKRLKLEENGKGQRCLFLKNLQKSDEGEYICKIFKGWDEFDVRKLFLKVKECRILQAVKAVPGKAVVLNCSVNTPPGLQGPLNTSWVMVKGSNEVSVDIERAQVNGTCLTFQSVADSDGGWYRCTYLHGQSQRCSDTHLLLQAEDTVVVTEVPFKTTISEQALTTSETVLTDGKEKSTETLVPVLVSVISVIITIAALTGLFIYCRPQTQRRSQQSQRFSTEYSEVYENSYDGRPPGNSQHQLNTLYQPQEENLCNTFHY